MKKSITRYFRLFPLFFLLFLNFSAHAQGGSGCLPVGNFTMLPLGPLPGAGTAFISAEYGSPTVIQSGCNDPRSVRMRAEIVNPFFSPGDGVRYTTFAGGNPQPTFLANNVYNISFNVAIDSSTTGLFDEVYIYVKAANNLQSGLACSGSCEEISFAPVADLGCSSVGMTGFIPAQDYQNLVFAAYGTYLEGFEELWVKLDNICVENVTPCNPAFTWIGDACGNVQFTNTSDPSAETTTWTFSGPGLPPGGVEIEDNEPNFYFPSSGSYSVTMSVLCNNGGTGTITQTINVTNDNIPPVITGCPNESYEFFTQAPDCNYPYPLPNISAMDNSGNVTMNCTFNGAPVNPGQTVLLPPGIIHNFTCVATDNCGNTSTCVWLAAVVCDTLEPTLPCDGFDDGLKDNWNVYNTYPNGSTTFGNNNVVIGAPSITGNPTDYYLEFKDVSGSTWALNKVDYNGDWNQYLGNCLCFDYKVQSDGDANSVIPVFPAIYLTGPVNTAQPFNYGTNPVLMAEFKVNTPVTELDGWNSYCAPLELCGPGNTFPSNATGSWSMLAGSGCNDWAALLSNVGGMMFRLDFTSYPAEKIRVDNICIKDCCETPPCSPGDLCDSIMVMVDTVLAPPCFDPAIITGLPCPANFDPVCGCNGQTYSNACVAEENGITTYVPGECSVNNPPPTPQVDGCCYNIDLKIPDGLAFACFEMLTPGVIFNTAMLTNAGFKLDTLVNGTKICIRDNAPGHPHLTGGMYNDLLKLCLGNVNDSTQYPQCVEVTFWQLNPVDVPVLVCTDSIKFYCEPPVHEDTCVLMQAINVQCDPDDPNLYHVTFGVCNHSGFTASQVVLTSNDPNINFLPCGFNLVPQPSIGIPLSPALASGACDNTLCVDVVSSVPITSSYLFCTELSIWNSSMCCTSPVNSCIILQPCCDPCEQKDVVSHEITGNGPKTVFFPPVKDGYIFDSNFSLAYGNAPNMLSGVGSVGVESFTAELFVDFDFENAICQGANITHAELQFFANNSGPGHNDVLMDDDCWKLARVVTPWTESTLFADDPQASPLNQIPINAPNYPYENYTTDVTQLVLDMMANPSGSHGFNLFTNCGHDHLLDFATRENPNGALHPVLQIIYEDTQCDSVPMGNCCHSLDLVNDCEIDYFTKVELVSATPGVNIGSHFTGGTNPLDWTVVKSTAQCVQWEHASGYIPFGTTANLINFCLSDIDPGETPQVMYLHWYTTNSVGETVIACTDTLKYECPAENNGCVGVVDLTLNGDSCNVGNMPSYTLTLQNNSTPPHFATSLMMNSITPGVTVFPNNFIFPGAGLPPAGIATVNFNLLGTFNPGDMIKIEMRLHDSATGDDWCCFESDTLCITIPDCSDSCCDISQMAFTSLFNAGLQFNLDGCEVCFPFNLDSCDVLTVDYNDGNVITYQAGDSVCHTYAAPGGPHLVGITWTRYDKNGNICKELSDTVDLLTECGDSCCQDYNQFLNLINMGWTITYGDSCRVTVTAPQFDSCHYLSRSTPDWGDGTPIPGVVVPANGVWTHQYAQPGTYNICGNISEGSIPGGLCWDTTMCTPVTVNCAPTPSCCNITQPAFDSLLQNIVLQPVMPGDCEVCFNFAVDTCDILHITFGDGSFAVITGGTGTQCHTYTTAGVYTATISLTRLDGNGDTCRFAQTTIPVKVDCTPPPSCCDISQAAFDSLLQNIVLQPVTPNNCEICLNYAVDSCDVLTITYGDGNSTTLNGPTAGVQCHTYATSGTYMVSISLIRYDAMGNICRQAQTAFPVTVNCAPPPSCCDITQTAFDSLLQNIVLQPVMPNSCEICVDFLLDSCDVVSVAFGDGNSILLNAGTAGTQCYTYAASGTYTVNITMVRFDAMGNICRQAQTTIPVTINCTPPPSCCDITQTAFDSLLQNIVLQPVTPNSCEICLNYAVDSCDVLTITFGDGNSITLNGPTTGVQCHTYTTPGTYTVSVALTRYDAMGNICRQAQTSFPVTVDCTPPPSCCDISQAAFDSLLQNIVLQPVMPNNCEVCFSYSVGNCDYLHFNFGDGSTVLFNGGAGQQCHTFASGTYNIVVSLIRVEPTGDTCRFAQTTFPVTVDCTLNPNQDCCGITTGAFDSLFTNVTNYTLDGCQICWPALPDSCDVLTVDYGNGVSLTYGIGDSLCYTYPAPGGTFTLTVTLSRFDSLGNVCHERDTTFGLQPDCAFTNCDAENIKIYNAMSPDDGDNLNEVLLIENYDNCGRIDISIYNRWGQLVWQQADYDNTWKGTSTNGKPLPDGTYYLLLELPEVDERTQKIRIQTFIDIRRD